MFSNISVFQKGQHFDQNKLAISGPHLSASSCIPIKYSVMIPLLCRQNDLFLSLRARAINKTGLSFSRSGKATSAVKLFPLRQTFFLGLVLPSTFISVKSLQARSTKHRDSTYPRKSSISMVLARFYRNHLMQVRTVFSLLCRNQHRLAKRTTKL